MDNYFNEELIDDLDLINDENDVDEEDIFNYFAESEELKQEEESEYFTLEPSDILTPEELGLLNLLIISGLK